MEMKLSSNMNDLLNSRKNFLVVDSNNRVIGDRESYFAELPVGVFTVVEHDKPKGSHLRRLEFVREVEVKKNVRRK